VRKLLLFLISLPVVAQVNNSSPVNSQFVDGFTIQGYNAQNVVGTGLKVINIVNHNPDTVYVNGLHVTRLFIWRFDTAIDVRDLTNAIIRDDYIAFVKTGIRNNGQNLNVIYDGINYLNPSTSYTSSPGFTTGFTADSYTYPDGSHGSEGITLTNSTIIQMGTAVYAGQIRTFNVSQNIFDICSSNCMVDANADHIFIDHNYIGVDVTGAAGVDILNGTSLDGTQITNNQFVSYLGGDSGIETAASGTHRGMVIAGNNFAGFKDAMFSIPILHFL
jgi:hypothetical protein